MNQRLLLLLSILFISAASMAQNNNVMTSTDGDNIYNSGAMVGSLTNPTAVNNLIQKWVHDPNQPGKSGRIPWDQSNFKSYRFNSTSFRLRFPNNYDATKKYPLVIFLHGAGEAADPNSSHNTSTINRENQDQLFWGAQTFETRMNQGEWNGFLLFPQLFSGSAEWDADHTIPPVNNILDTLTKYNGLDPDRVIVMGLSAGGIGCIHYAQNFPTRIATVVTSCPENISGQAGSVSSFLQLPVWLGAGGQDGGLNNPTPSDIIAFRNSFANAGGNLYLDYYPVQGHVMWMIQWNKTDIHGNLVLSSFWNNANKAQPLLYFQNNEVCEGMPISAKMALTPGFYSYEWQKDNVTIGGATSYTYTATQAGTYQVHFKRTMNSEWSAWTPKPVVISTKKCTVDTAYAEHFEGPVAYIARKGDGSGSNSSYYLGNYDCQNGVFTNASESFTQDATGRMGGRFMLNSTVSKAGCTYGVGDQVWHNAVTVQPFTDYVLNFSLGNQENFYYGGTPGLPPAVLSAVINGTTITPAGGVRTTSLGDVSWKKFSYIWNSGNTPNNIADIGVVNNTLDSRWNDFALDEISLVKFKTPPMPGLAFNNVTLWTKANSITDKTDSTPLGLWTNSDVNGDNLIQYTASALPVLRNNAADNINFNPIVNFTAANGSFMQAPLGFSGTTAHTAVTAYVVAKFNSLTQDDKTILTEPQASNNVVKVVLTSNGRLTWTAGSDYSQTSNFANTINTPNNSIEINKPIVWSFSKDNNNTASGNKQDIRKNGVVIATGNNTSSFTGNGSSFGIGQGGKFFNGQIAEVVYLLDSAVTSVKQNQVESYLALKYGTTLGNSAAPVSYTASDGTTVFWTGNTSYQNDVFGIGKDSLSGLLQTISNSVNSGSGDGTGQSAKGNLVLSTTDDLLDKRFLVIGNDAGALTQQVITGAVVNPIALGSTRINRNWKVSNTGSVGAVSLSFDTTGLDNQAGGATVNKYALMISNSGDATYHGTLSFFTATSGSGKKINFSGVTLTNGSVFTIITNNLNIALPAVWLGFTADAVNGNALLNWKTGDEINVDRYTVEHSFNGVSFSAVGTVAANNNTGENNYTFTNVGLAPGIHYYRIRRTDKDGKSEYSDTKTVKIITAGANVQVRPNPVAGSVLALSVSVQQANKTNVQVTGVDGKIIVQQNLNLAAGINLVNINIAMVPPGVYLVQVQLKEGVVTKKFIKER
ncbi:MAG: T9SS type A sorting domain-containing protein [Bacteroidota bacterium]